MTVPDQDFQDRAPSPDEGPEHTARPDEAVLIERVRAGDQGALEMVVDTYLKGMTHFAYAIVGSMDAADDVVQAVFVQLWEHRVSLDPALSLPSYLFRLVRNRALNDRRATTIRERHRQQVQADLAADATPAIVRSFEGTVLNEATLEALLQQLPERRRLAIRLRFTEQLTHAEIAEVLGLSTRAVENLVFRAVEDLRKLWGE